MARGPLKTDLRDLAPVELERLVISLGHERYRSDQVLHWLYKKQVVAFNEMKNMPLDLRGRLAEEFSIRGLREIRREISLL